MMLLFGNRTTKILELQEIVFLHIDANISCDDCYSGLAIAFKDQQQELITVKKRSFTLI